MFYMALFMMAFILAGLFTFLTDLSLRRTWLPGLMGCIVGFIADYIAVQLDLYEFIRPVLSIGGVASFHVLTVGVLSMIIIPLWPKRLSAAVYYLTSISIFIVIMELIGVTTGNFAHIHWNYGWSFVANMLVLLIIYGLTQWIGAWHKPSKAGTGGTYA